MTAGKFAPACLQADVCELATAKYGQIERLRARVAELEAQLEQAQCDIHHAQAAAYATGFADGSA